MRRDAVEKKTGTVLSETKTTSIDYGELLVIKKWIKFCLFKGIRH